MINDEFTNAFKFNPPVTPEMIEMVEVELNKNLPGEYKRFMAEHNGGEDPIGNENYLVVWPVEELVELNKCYAVHEFTPGLLYFGSDGGSTAYAFDFRDEFIKIVEVPLDLIRIEDVVVCGTTFNDFLIKLRSE